MDPNQQLAGGDVTALLRIWSDGDKGAFDRLMPLAYDELHRMALHYLAGGRAEVSLQATALVNEVCLQLLGWDQARWQNRSHFFGVSAQMMRRVLVDIERRRRADRREGPTMVRLPFETVDIPASERDTDLVAIDRARADRLAQTIARDGWSLRRGVTIGPYTILQLLGSGGAGEVWQARDERLHRDVAIKVLLPHVASDAGRLCRFAEEARAAGALHHSNLLTVYDVGSNRSVSNRRGMTSARKSNDSLCQDCVRYALKPQRIPDDRSEMSLPPVPWADCVVFPGGQEFLMISADALARRHCLSRSTGSPRCGGVSESQRRQR